MDPATHELRYVVDPGIGGRIHEYHGKTIPRLDSPKATIMALIADGILTHKLPWVLVLLGVFLTIAIELMGVQARSEEHTSELQSRRDLVCRLLLEKKNKNALHHFGPIPPSRRERRLCGAQ